MPLCIHVHEYTYVRMYVGVRVYTRLYVQIDYELLLYVQVPSSFVVSVVAVELPVDMCCPRWRR